MVFIVEEMQCLLLEICECDVWKASSDMGKWYQQIQSLKEQKPCLAIYRKTNVLILLETKRLPNILVALMQ